MQTTAIKVSLAAMFGGTLIFFALVAVSLGIAQFNADTMPGLPWFAVPVLAVVFGVFWWIDRRWDIGLRTPLKAPVALVAAFAVVATIAARSVWVLEKAWHGTVYAAPTGPEGTSALFLATYWIVISIALSTSSEACFRGIMQSQLSRHLPLWAAIVTAIFFNTFSHPLASLWPRFFAVVAILYAWGWLRHISGSLKACILAHIATVMGVDVIFWLTGPVDFGTLSTTALALTVGIGLAALGASVYLSRRITGKTTEV